MKHLNQLLFLALCILLASCSKEEGCTDINATNYNPNADKSDDSCIYPPVVSEKGTFKLNFNLTSSNGQALVINQPYSDSANYTIQIEGFQFYISNLALIKTNNQEVSIKDVDLISFNTSNENNTEALAAIGDYKGIKFGIGLDSTQNASDPTTFANDHPLSLFQNTYWNWSSQYRFIMIEGRADTTIGSSANINQLLIYHTGLNSLYRETQINENFSISLNNTHQMNLTINLNKLFYGSFASIDLKTESTTHATTNYLVAEKVTENFITAIE